MASSNTSNTFNVGLANGREEYMMVSAKGFFGFRVQLIWIAIGMGLAMGFGTYMGRLKGFSGRGVLLKGFGVMEFGHCGLGIRWWLVRGFGFEVGRQWIYSVGLFQCGLVIRKHDDGNFRVGDVNPSTYRNSSVFRKQVCTIVKQNNH